MKEDIIRELDNGKDTLELAKDYIENHSISKVDLLLYLQELNKDHQYTEVVRGFYNTFFSEKEKDENER